METGTPKLIEKAEGLLDDALNLTGVLLAAVAGDSDTRGMQCDATLRVIERKLEKARRCLDRLSR